MLELSLPHALTPANCPPCWNPLELHLESAQQAAGGRWAEVA